MTGRAYMNNKSNKNYRKNQGGLFFTKNKAIIMAVIFVLVMLVGFGPLSRFFQPGSSVVEANHQLSDMKYKIVQIEEGDSLWTIAQDNMDPGFSDINEYIREVKRCNQMDSDTITAGNYLMVPYYEDLSPSVASLK